MFNFTIEKGWHGGCEASGSIGSKYHEEGGGDGWGFITQFLLDYSPIAHHRCTNVANSKIETAECDMQGLENCFNQFDIKR